MTTPVEVAAWTVRTATEANATALSTLAERTFRDAFATMNSAADMDLHCARSFDPAIQKAEIADPRGETLVVEHRGALVGYAQLHHGESPSCIDDGSAVELRRIYVLRAWQGSGVAPALLAELVRRAELAGGKVLWLGVWERNPRAIRFYEKHGFTAVGEHTFLLGSDPQRDLVLVRPLGERTA